MLFKNIKIKKFLNSFVKNAIIIVKVNRIIQNIYLLKNIIVKILKNTIIFVIAIKNSKVIQVYGDINLNVKLVIIKIKRI
jgi:hypothetical protein